MIKRSEYCADSFSKFRVVLFLCLCLLLTNSVGANCNDVLFKSNFQSSSNPSHGNRGPNPGAFNRSVVYNGNVYSYYISIPPDYNPNNPMPMMILWHGAAGAGTAPANAKATRDFWRPTADTNGFITVAQTATGSLGGGWVPDLDTPIMFEIIKDMERYYNIEMNKIYGYGFSAGGHVMHGIMLSHSETFAGYAISAGVLEAYAGLDAPVEATRKIPVFVSIGLQDTTGPNLLNLSRSNHTVFNNAGWVDGQNYWIDEFNGGHQIDINVPQKTWDKLCNQSL